MNIKQLELCNYKGFKKTTFEFHNKLNLFVGVNGSGKSTVVDSIALALSWLLNRIQRERANGSQIPESDLRNEADKCYIDIHTSYKQTDYRWFLTKSAKGYKSEQASYEGVTKLAKVISDIYHHESRLPVIAYYPVNRTVERVIPHMLSHDFISDWDVYENALSGKSNYQSLFEWFRRQDDILNEQAQSRSNWIRQHKHWVKRKINSILAKLEGLTQKEESYSKDEFKNLSKRFKDEFIFEEPRMLFLELSRLMHRFEIKRFRKTEMMHMMDDIEYIYHKMDSLSKELRDELIEDNDISFLPIEKFFESFKVHGNIGPNKEDNKLWTLLVWETFSFAILLSLWWMSDRGRRKIERLLNPNSSQILNFSGADKDFTIHLLEIIKEDIKSKKQIQRSEGKDLEFVRNAIETFFPEYQSLQVKRIPRPYMVLTKNDTTFDLNQLSVGEKNVIALIGDIARRLAMANPRLKNPLEGEGIVLIDEIDLHLHPKWQRVVIPQLLKVFSGCQFFITTHSPQAIGNVKPESVYILRNIENEIHTMQPDETYGMSVDRVVELIMDDYSRPDEPRKDLERLFELIERKSLNEAKELIAALKKYMHSDPDIMRAEMLIRMKERKA